MRRAILALAAATLLTVAMGLRVTAIGLTQVTLNCDDGTSRTMVVDTDTLNGLIASIQAMLDYPAGLSCTLIQVPLLSVGRVVLAADGDEFVVGGGRWLVSCAVFGEVGRAPGALMSWLRPAPMFQGEQFFVNIAVNGHTRVAPDGTTTFFGTLNETIPEGQTCPGVSTVGPRHFTSKFTTNEFPNFTGCVETVPSTTTNPINAKAFTRSIVTQISGFAFPSGTGGSLIEGSEITFSFIDHGNPGDLNPKDELRGPPIPDDSVCPTFQGTLDFSHLEAGNITVHSP